MKSFQAFKTVLGLVFLAAASVHAQSAPSPLTSYFGLKDALVGGDTVTSKRAAAGLTDALQKTDTATLTVGLRDTVRTATMTAEAIANTGDLAVQRDRFKALSAAMIALTKITPVKVPPGDTVYVQHCPMADKGAGASWLSNKKEIANPYFGDAMLKCGHVVETIAGS
jgi:hypothetical protein